jgi:hypothetical protein
MKQRLVIFPLLFLAVLFLLPGCGVIEGIFKAGMWTAFLIVGLVIALIIYIVARMRRK